MTHSKTFFVILSFLFTTLTSTLQSHTKILNIGHRGACGYAPENTLRAFQTAIDMGVDAIEFDVHMSVDGHAVIIHDNSLERTTNGTGMVAHKTLTELKALDAGAGQQIPTLQETLDLVDRKVKIFVELKGKKTAAPVARIIHHYVEHHGWTYDDFFMTTFDHQQLLQFKKLMPQVKTCAAYCCIPLDLAAAAHKHGVYGLTLLDDTLNKKFIDDAHRRGLKIFLAIFDYSNENIEYLKQFDFDGFYLNYPDKFEHIAGENNANKSTNAKNGNTAKTIQKHRLRSWRRTPLL